MNIKFFSILPMIFISMIAQANVIEYDTEDPLYIPAAQDLITRTGASYGDGVLKISEKIAYGFTDRLSIGAAVHYQHDFDGPADGFSNFDLGGAYRMSAAGEDSRIISDALFGVKFAGDRDVRDPEFADTVYYAGLRAGRQWAGLTLATTVKTSWIFDADRGMAFIDFMPEAYFRITENWRLGAAATLRKATNPNFDAQWLGGKIVRQYGRTQYVLYTDYEFEAEEWAGGARINILF